MENLIFIFAAALMLKRKNQKFFRRTNIGNNGCSALLLNEHRCLRNSFEPECNPLFFYESSDNGITYGVVYTELEYELNNPDAFESILASFALDLQEKFKISFNAGIDFCSASQNASVTKIIDYWQEKNSTDWKIKGYTDGKSLAILYVKNISRISVQEQDAFLDSFQF